MESSIESAFPAAKLGREILLALAFAETFILSAVGLLGAGQQFRDLLFEALFLFLQALWGWFGILTSANYVEHYGLLRQKLENGRYERCQPHHSWNSNHIMSNLILFNLQRHSDHHANATRRYQCLRNFDDLPQLPSGYPLMFAIAYIPPLWFAIMDKQLVASVDGDFSKLNVAVKNSSSRG